MIIIQWLLSPGVLAIALLCLLTVLAAGVADRVNKNWRPSVWNASRRLIRRLSAGFRPLRIAMIATLSVVLVWLTQPPEPEIVLPIRHARNVEFSADGTRLLVVSASSWIGTPESPTALQFSIWNVASRKTNATVIPYGGNWAWSPDGQYLAVLDTYCLSLMDTETGGTQTTVNIHETPPEKWTSLTLLPDLTAETVRELAYFKPKVFPRSVSFVTDALLIVTCQPEEGWQNVLEQRGMPAACQRRYRVPDLEDAGTELWTWLLENQHLSDSKPLIASEQSNGGGWRLLNADLLRTKVWIPEADRQYRTAKLSRDGSVLMTGIILSAYQQGKSQVESEYSGARLYDADIGGLLAEFPGEVNPLFSPDGSLLLTQSFSELDGPGPTVVHVRDARTGSLISSCDLGDWTRPWRDYSAQQANLKSTGKNTSPVAEVSEQRRLELQRLMMPGKFGTYNGLSQALHRIWTTNQTGVPFVGLQVHVWPSPQRSWLARLRRIDREVELIDIKNNRSLARVPGLDALGPNLDWAAELREEDVALWKLHGWRRPLSPRQAGCAMALTVAAFLFVRLWRAWTARFRSIGAIETKSGKSQ